MRKIEAAKLISKLLMKARDVLWAWGTCGCPVPAAISLLVEVTVIVQITDMTTDRIALATQCPLLADILNSS